MYISNISFVLELLFLFNTNQGFGRQIHTGTRLYVT